MVQRNPKVLETTAAHAHGFSASTASHGRSGVFAWATGFEVNADGTLVAELGDLAPEFVSAVKEGRYRKISMKFFARDAPNNPKPGTFYPRHIGFLGGAAPAVSGLTPVEFADADEEGSIEIMFAEPALEDVASLFRSMREFIIEKFSRKDADEAIPEYLIRWVDNASDAPAETSPGFTAPKPKEPAMSGSETELAAREQRVAERERAQCQTESVSFAEGLITEGKLLPALRDGVVALLTELGNDDAEISFSEDGTTTSMGSAQLLKNILSAQPEVVPGGKIDIGDAPNAGAAPAFASPDGLAVDPDGLALHQKAVAFQAQHPGTEYIAAVQAVEGT